MFLKKIKNCDVIEQTAAIICSVTTDITLSQKQMTFVMAKKIGEINHLTH